MSFPVQQQVKYWGIAALVLVVLLWLLGDVIMPFLLGGAIAYCLDPIADRLERLGFSRIWATVTITAAAVLMFIVIILLVIPTLVRQTTAFIEAAPDLIQNFQVWLTEKFPQIMDADSAVRQQLITIGETIRSKGGEVLNGLLSSAMSLVNVLVLLIVVPVVTFYLLLDWDNMTARIDELLPRDHIGTIRQIARDIDATLASFIRGQGTVMLIQGLFYAIGLSLVGLQFGLIVGALAGLLSFIPYVGAIIGGGLAIGLALFQFWNTIDLGAGAFGPDWVRIVVVVVIFFSGQIIEGNFLTPKLVGNSVGLHPVWLIFALSAFGTLFGFVGLLVAVPVSAMIGVLIRFALVEYKSGRLYRGLSDDT